MRVFEKIFIILKKHTIFKSPIYITFFNNFSLIIQHAFNFSPTHVIYAILIENTTYKLQCCICNFASVFKKQACKCYMYIYKIASVLRRISEYRETFDVIFISYYSSEKGLTSFSFCIRVQTNVWRHFHVRLHTAINRTDFVSWWMWFNGPPTIVQRNFLTNAFCYLRMYITCIEIRNRPD